MSVQERDELEEGAGPIRLKDLVRPEDFAALPLLERAKSRFVWQVGHSVTYFGSYLKRPIFFELVRRDAVLSDPSFEDIRFLVIELTDDQFEQALELHETAIGARNADNLMHYSRSADELRNQVQHLGEQLGRLYRENIVLGWIDGRPNTPDSRNMW